MKKRIAMAHMAYCCYCGEYFMLDLRPSNDHLIPTCKGGIDDLINKRKACINCNNDKKDYYPHQWLRHLLNLRKSTVRSNYPVHLVKERVEKLNKKILNLEQIVLYVNEKGLSLFVDKYHYEWYKDTK